MAHTEITSIKIEFLKKLVKKPGTIRILMALIDSDKSCSQLREAAAAPRPDRMMQILGITRRFKDDYGIINYGLTKNGRNLMVALRFLFDTLEDVLPEEE